MPVLNKFERKINEKGAVISGRGFTYMDYIIKVVESLEKLGQLIDGVTETVNINKKTRGQTFWGLW